MNDFISLPGTLDAAWHRLIEGARDAEAPASRLVLATARQDGGAEARIIILRSADRAAARLCFHTDAASAKVEQIRNASAVTLLAWDPVHRFQIRLRATARSRKGNATEWASLSASQRRLYGGMQLPGSRPDDPAQVLHAGDPDRFLVVEAQIREIETLWLDAELHRRAVFSRGDGFAGHWRAP